MVAVVVAPVVAPVAAGDGARAVVGGLVVAAALTLTGDGARWGLGVVMVVVVVAVTAGVAGGLDVEGEEDDEDDETSREGTVTTTMDS